MGDAEKFSEQEIHEYLINACKEQSVSYNFSIANF